METTKYMIGNLVNSYEVIGRENEDLEYVYDKVGEPILSVITHTSNDGSHAAFLNGKSKPNTLYLHEPIIITGELLLNLGFENKSYNLRNFDKVSIRYVLGCFEWYDSTICVEFDNGISGYSLYTAIDTVHELQNLYRVLTGEELQYVDK